MINTKKTLSRKCSFRYCTEKSPTSNCTFFGFPKDPERYKQWIEISQCTLVDGDTKMSQYYLCEKHFSPNYISVTPRRKILLNTAVPEPFFNEYLEPPLATQQQSPKKLIEESLCHVSSSISTTNIIELELTDCDDNNSEEFLICDEPPSTINNIQQQETIIYEFAKNDEHNNDDCSSITSENKETNEENCESLFTVEAFFFDDKNYGVGNDDEQNNIEEDEVLEEEEQILHENNFAIEENNVNCEKEDDEQMEINVTAVDEEQRHINDKQLNKHKTKIKQKYRKYKTYFTDKNGTEYIQMPKAEYIQERQLLTQRINNYRLIFQRLRRELNNIV